MTGLSAIVVSLPSASRRRRFVGRALERIDLSYMFLDATSGADLDSDWIEKNVSSELRSRLKGRNHAASYVNTVACADSHRRAQRFVASADENRFYLILEDDVLVDRALVSRWREIESALKLAGRDIALAGYSLPQGAEPGAVVWQSGRRYSLREYPSTKTLGAFGYLVTPAGARMLLRCNDDLIRDTADNFRINELDLSDATALLSPKLVSSGYMPTTIGYPGRSLGRIIKLLGLKVPLLRWLYSRRQMK